ncbi:MAG: PAS domain S-box protein, partial [Promethearchaeota archaeon]
MGEKPLNIHEDLFKAIYDDSPIGIELYDSKGKLIDVNQSCMELFGVSSKDHVKGFDLMNDPNIPKEYLTKLKHRETVKFESIFDFDLVKKKKLYKTSKSGKIYLDVLITPIFLGKKKAISNYLVQVQDISSKKIAEVKLIDLNDELESRILKKAEELKKFKKISDNANYGIGII